MPTKQERIQKLRDRAAEYRQTAEAKEEEARKLAVEDRKIQADKNRKHETKVKINLGAGLLLLEGSVHVPIVRAIRSVLASRDQKFIAQWCESHEDDFDEFKFRSVWLMHYRRQDLTKRQSRKAITRIPPHLLIRNPSHLLPIPLRVPLNRFSAGSPKEHSA